MMDLNSSDRGSVSPNDSEAKILAAIAQSEARTSLKLNEVASELSETKGTVIRIEGRVFSIESQCTLRHKHLDKDISGIHSDIGKLQRHDANTEQVELAKLQKKLDEENAEKRKWTFWLVTTAIGFLLSGSGVTLLYQLFTGK